MVSPESDGARRGIVVQSPKGVELLAATSGEPIWSVQVECDAIASSTPYEDRLYVPTKWLTAVELNPENAAGAAAVWDAKLMKPTSASPVLRDGKVYAIIAAECSIAMTSPVPKSTGRRDSTELSGLHPYSLQSTSIASMPRETHWCLTWNGAIITEINMVEGILASPAVSGNAMFVRSHRHLWKIAE